MPAKEAETRPWSKLCVDTVGPYRVQRKGKPDLIFQAVTFIDPATGWFEIKQCQTKKAHEVSNLIEQTWFSRYPWLSWQFRFPVPVFKSTF